MNRTAHTALLIAALIAASVIAAAPAHARLLGQRREAAALPEGARIERDIAYGPHAKQRFDVYLPAAAHEAPILLMVHGGAWRIGDKDNPGLAGAKAAYWLSRGWVFVATNYRLLPDADPLEQARDVAAALAAVQRRAPRWGADPARVVLMGHSAGAHLVALVGASPALWTQAGALRPRGAVSLDSAAMNVPEMMEKPRLPKLYRDAFGNDRAFWTAASPYHRLTGEALPMLIVCSMRRPDSCPQASALQDRAAALGVPMQVLPENLSHAEVNRDLGKPSPYTAQVAAYIDGLLR
ncbi:MAG: alpha/beta hydrolase [Immundisolibacter sp.]|uniref:alpha/beta hydrolase n=1 Tax=Immundisolibacter sp. TaxID=1934948 RepID=UPI0019CACDA6|nr:alpha/beta hydrolase [Immundisolibacter sp.]MBC7160589.1 alpha/beta hydrolase [Immundisolibacter sp.]